MRSVAHVLFLDSLPARERHKKNPEKSVNFSGFGIIWLSP
ncbi:hypothetical protein CES85_0472 [Ochrobactrum quorumnocens]|uniref:Uncharacterized protein n=1 Tax=Ochrobactrum quorumnocens TaxID=271865 RepID=A0A248UKY5_9HYPH|nr:hypothetical protein CES85_0472 [[Ochrobactrum] quorumnocens]